MASTSAAAAPSAQVDLPNVPGMRCNDMRNVNAYPADGWIVTISAPCLDTGDHKCWRRRNDGSVVLVKDRHLVEDLLAVEDAACPLHVEDIF